MEHDAVEASGRAPREEKDMDRGMRSGAAWLKGNMYILFGKE